MKRLGWLFACLMWAGAAHAALPASEIPMYGDAAKSKTLKESDAAYIASIEKSGKSRRDVAKEVMRTGWAAYQKGDLKTAIRRFNQAWLLDPENGDAYHGFALISTVRDKNSTDAEKFFRIALSKPGVNEAAYVSYGRFLWLVGRLDESLAQLQKALEVSAAAHNARSEIAMVYYKKKDFANACEFARRARDNKDDLMPNFLEEMCKQGATG